MPPEDTVVFVVAVDAVDSVGWVTVVADWAVESVLSPNSKVQAVRPKPSPDHQTKGQ